MKKIVTTFSKVIIASFTGMFLFAGAASAHVSIQPAASTPSAWETYTLKVPVEKDVPTTKVVVKIPDGVTFVNYQKVPEWKVTLDKGPSNNVQTVSWTATGEGILAGQFQQFTFVAKNPESETDIAWDAFQYYKDGSIVEWNGNEGSGTPHSVTKISTASTAPEQQDSHHEHDAVETEQAAPDKGTGTDSNKADEEDTNPPSQTAPLILSIASLILSIAAIILAIRKKK